MEIAKGRVYLFMERVPLKTHQVVREELSRGRKALYISKNAPGILHSQFEFDDSIFKTKWLSPRTRDTCIPPMNLDLFQRNIEKFILTNDNGIVVINGIDVLEKWNGFHPVLQVLKVLQEELKDKNGNIIISLNPESHFRNDLDKLRLISHKVISSGS